MICPVHVPCLKRFQTKEVAADGTGTEEGGVSSGALSQGEAAETLGVSERIFRRWRDEGAEGVYDRRLGFSARASADEVADRSAPILSVLARQASPPRSSPSFQKREFAETPPSR